jgi:hypothetical protein
LSETDILCGACWLDATKQQQPWSVVVEAAVAVADAVDLLDE